MKLLITANARRDLKSIAAWIERDSPARALSFVRELRAACFRILDAPLGYPLLPSHEHVGIRKKVHGNYLIFYVVKSESVEVLHILHGARDYETLLVPPP